MTIIEVCTQSVDHHQAYEIRQKCVKDDEYHYEMRMAVSPSSKGWVLLDVQSANAVLTVYKALKPENQKNFNKVQAFRLITWCWEQMK